MVSTPEPVEVLLALPWQADSTSTTLRGHVKIRFGYELIYSNPQVTPMVLLLSAALIALHSLRGARPLSRNEVR